MKRAGLNLLILSGFLLPQPFHIASVAPQVVQSVVVEFPTNRKVIVQAIEEFDKNPRMLFINQRTGKILLDYTYEGEGFGELLKPERTSLVRPFLRFRVVRSKGFDSPLILAVAVSPGGSDNGFWGVVAGEVDGKLKVLTPGILSIPVQGGFYIGYLNK